MPLGGAHGAWGSRGIRYSFLIYTTTFWTYWVRTVEEATKLTKNPVPVTLGNESEESSSEEEILPLEVLDWDQPDPPPIDLGLAAALKKKWRTVKEWTNIVGSRKSTKDRKPKTSTVGADRGHPTD